MSHEKEMLKLKLELKKNEQEKMDIIEKYKILFRQNEELNQTNEND